MNIIVDMNCLGYRAYYTTGALSVEDKMTGVMYGVLREIKNLFSFMPSSMVLCFDSKASLRKQLYPGYKKRLPNPEKDKAKKAVGRQLSIIRKHFKESDSIKTLMYKGYEADDCIAHAAMNLNNPIIIVSADKDLYTLLTLSKVTIYNPIAKTYFRKFDFIQKYGFQPIKWTRLKAMAGCSSDRIPGIARIGEKTAIDFLSGKMPTEKKNKIQQKLADNEKEYRRNYQLVSLPYMSERFSGPFTHGLDMPSKKPQWEDFLPLVNKYKMKTLL